MKMVCDATFPVRERIVFKLLSKKNKVFKKKQLFYSVKPEKPDEIKEFEEVFKLLEKNDFIIINKNGKIKVNNDEDYFIGKIYFSPNGFGFVNHFREEKNYFVKKENSGRSFHEDIVLAKKFHDQSKPEAKVIMVIRRTISKIVGTYMASQDFGFVIPDESKINLDIYIPKGSENGAKSYDKVVVEINRNIIRKNPYGEVIEVLGLQGEKEADYLSIIKAYDLRDKFPNEVMKEASELKMTIDEDDIKNRIDFRDRTIFTIDDIAAKDLDDAISIKKDGNFYEVGVYIADVSHYVKANSAIDKEAFLRGNSVYLIDKVIPMLPKVLSNNLCSLNENKDRLVLAVLMRVDKYGRVVKSNICEGVIHSKGRLTYDEVTAYLEGKNPQFSQKFPEIAKDILIAKELAEALVEKRARRGSIDFDIDESYIKLDENGNPIVVEAYRKGIANSIIEELMILANETVAKKFFDLGIPFVYRIHDKPRTEKLEAFVSVANAYGLKFKVKDLKNIQPKDLQEFLSGLANDKIKTPLKIILLQSMQQARYSNENMMHFGLASEFYSHFTSPIRRYPDLQIHRIIKEYLHNELNNLKREKYEKIASEVARHCSRMERIAEKAEEEFDKLKISEFIMNNKDVVFEGIIRNFNKAGIYVMLKNTADGFIKIPDFQFNEKNYTGILNGKKVELGDIIKVKPKVFNLNTKEIIFEVVES